MALNRNWRESRREERLRGRKELEGSVQKQEQQQTMP